VSGGLVRKARDAVRRRRTELFTNVVAPSMGRLSLVRGFCVRACVQGPHREILATGANRTQQVTSPAESSLCARLSAPLRSARKEYARSKRPRLGAIGVSDESKAFSGAFL